MNSKEITLVKWARIVKDRAGNRCEICGADGVSDRGRLESHHFLPISEHPAQRLEITNGLCLCHRCHLAVHGGSYNSDKPRPDRYILHGDITPAEASQAQRAAYKIYLHHVADSLR